MTTPGTWLVEAEAALASDLELARLTDLLEEQIPEHVRPALRSLCRSCYLAGFSSAKREGLEELRRLALLRRANRPPLWRRLWPW